MDNKPIIFFDGICSLCNGFINFLVSIKAHKSFNVASLQGNHAKKLLSDINMETIILYEDGKTYIKSEAIFRILKKLCFPWKLIMVFSILPRAFTDMIYEFISKNRYDIFGKKDSCRIPTEEEKSFFLD